MGKKTSKNSKIFKEKGADSSKFEYFGGKELVAGALAFIALIVLCACSERIVYKDVLIPTKCDVAERKKPRYTSDFLQDLNATLIYSEGLKRDVDYCRGVK